MLGRIPDTFDKRQGSVIYDALAPAAAELAQNYIQLEIWKEQTYLLTAIGINLDNRGGDFSVTRFPATYARRIARMYDQNDQLTNISLGSRFATPSETGGIAYVTVNRLDLGLFVLECEVAGTIGNEYFGDILPLFILNNLGRAEIIDTQIPARDIESDDDYRERILARMNQAAFGGNIADYKRFTKEIDGVGNVKVFPVWNGGGTVLLSAIDASYDPISQQFMDIIKQEIDPTEDTGLGVGIAPIGHTVTITTPEKLAINVSATVTLDNRTIGQIQSQAEANISDYFRTVRADWADHETIDVFAIQVANAILKIDGVINVTGVTLNGSPNDMRLESTAQVQQLPYLEVLTLA